MRNHGMRVASATRCGIVRPLRITATRLTAGHADPSRLLRAQQQQGGFPMSVSHLIPWNRNRLSHLSREVRDPLLTLHREMNRLFDDFIGQFDLPSMAEGIDTTIAAWPHVELNDTEKDVVLTAELPGMSE